jgi:REP element-mobilizing transposase RayT
MSREPRLVLAGTALHITARRNYRHNVFDPENHAGYLNLLARYAAG